MQIQNEIIELENKYWKAMAESDVETAVSLTRFPCLVSGPRGTNLVTENDYREMMAAHPGDQFRNIKLENTKVESGVIYAGVPAKKVKDINQELINGEINRIANNSLMYSGWFKQEK